MNSLEPMKLSFNLDDYSVNPKVSEYEARLEEIQKEKDFEAYKKSGVPAKFFNESLETFIAETDEEKRNLYVVRQFCKNPKNKVLLLSGFRGNGKSHLLCGIIRECGGEYISSLDLCVEYESATSYHSPRTRNEILKHYSTVSMLVIDECGKYSPDEKLEQFLLSYIFSTRYENNLATAAATNANKKGLIEFLGKSVFDRFIECCTTLDFTGASKRRRIND